MQLESAELSFGWSYVKYWTKLVLCPTWDWVQSLTLDLVPCGTWDWHTIGKFASWSPITIPTSDPQSQSLNAIPNQNI